MKFGIRKPNIEKSIKARTTEKIKRKVNSTMNPLYEKKGIGYVNDPKKAIYNKVYNKTSISVTKAFIPKSGDGIVISILKISFLPAILVVILFYYLYKACKKIMKK